MTAAKLDDTSTISAMGAVPDGAMNLAWEVVYGDSRRLMAIGNLLGNDVLRMSRSCADHFAHVLNHGRGHEDLYRALGALAERCRMM